ncbi:MAG: hypothetical protein ACREIV_17180, partial [Planctomycetaceae bacterium]
MRSSRLALAAALAAALTLGLVVPASAASPNSARHCVTILAADPASRDAAVKDAIALETRCFATFAEGFEYGSRGAIRVPANL